MFPSSLTAAMQKMREAEVERGLEATHSQFNLRPV
jgi:hypothetical protein